MMRVVERREWIDSEGKARCEIVFEDPRTDARYTLTASPAAFSAHLLGMEVPASARVPDSVPGSAAQGEDL